MLHCLTKLTSYEVLNGWIKLHCFSRFMSVSSGAELASKGRELVCHFQTQGTPIMIGEKAKILHTPQS
jgi:hypothetical protein